MSQDASCIWEGYLLYCFTAIEQIDGILFGGHRGHALPRKSYASLSRLSAARMIRFKTGSSNRWADSR